MHVRIHRGTQEIGGSCIELANDAGERVVVTADGSAFRGLKRGFAMLRPEQVERRYITSGDTTQTSPMRKKLSVTPLGITVVTMTAMSALAAC